MRTIKNVARRISPTQEDYLRAIYLLSKDGAETGIVAIAERLQLSKSTVSERVKELTTAGLTDSKPYSAITLTTKGKNLAKKLTFKHRLIEVFLHETLKVPKEHIHAEAEKLEHAFSDEVIARLDTFLNHPTHDPHGSPINK